MNQPSREAMAGKLQNYADGEWAIRRCGDTAKGRALTPQLIPVLQAVCAPGFADGVSLF